MRFNKRVIIWLSFRGKLKLLFSIGLVAFLVTVLSWRLPIAMHMSSDLTLPLSGQIIAIDPGHGGQDGGAVSRDGVVEKNINLTVSLYLRDYLQQGGAFVVMTREVDKDLADPGAKRRKTQDLHKRAQFVINNKADMLISIHMNSIPSSRWRGAQTFYNPHQNKDNKLLAAFIQEEIKVNMKNTDREVNTILDTYLLKTVTMPAALVEVGFLSNPEEARLIADELYQKKMAEAIYRGILRFASGELLGSP